MSFIKVGSHFRSSTGRDRRPSDSPQKGDVLIFDAWLSKNSTPFTGPDTDPGLVTVDGVAQDDEITEAQAKQIAALMQSNSNQTNATDLDDVLSHLDGASAQRTQTDQETFNKIALGALDKLTPLGPTKTPPPVAPSGQTPGKQPGKPPTRPPSAASKKPTPAPSRQSGGGNQTAEAAQITRASREGTGEATPQPGATPDGTSDTLQTVAETAGVVGVFVLTGALLVSIFGGKRKFKAFRRGRR